MEEIGGDVPEGPDIMLPEASTNHSMPSLTA